MFTDTVSVSATDSISLAKHFGSAYTMTDFESKAHNFYLAASFMPTPKLSLTGSFTFNKSEGAMGNVIMPDVRAQLGDTLSHQDFTFNELHTYSDIDFKMIQLGLSAEYKLTPSIGLTAGIDYADLEDKTGYVYGSESGSFFLIRSGVRIDF